jgi:MFS family permease
MSATPIQMHHIDHFNHSDTGLAIQSHIFAMYFPSLFSGYLIRRLGVHRLVQLGIGIFFLSLFTAWLNREFLNYWWSMIFLGVGWNFLFLAGSTWISTQYTGADRFAAQGANDTFVFGTQALASGIAGPLVFMVGWNHLLLFPIPLLLFLSFFQYSNKKNMLKNA